MSLETTRASGGAPSFGWGRLAVAIAAAAVYANAIPNEFVWDDVGQVRDNSFIKETANLGKVFGRSYWDVQSSEERAKDVHYRPLTNASYILSHAVAGTAPAAYRAFNVVVHAVNAVLVATLAFELGVGGSWALFAGLLFAVHPALTEAVAWIVGRAELAATSCALGALLAWLRAFRSGRFGLLALSSGLLLCGLLFKESAAGAVGVALALGAAQGEDPFPRRIARSLAYALPLVASVAVYFALRWAALGATRYEDRLFFANAEGWQVLLTMSKVLLYYLWLLLAPFNLRAHYDTLDFRIPRSPADPVALLALALDALLVAAIVWGIARRSLAAVGAAWVLAALSPYLHLIPFQWLLGERFLYLAAGGWALLLARTGERLAGRLAGLGLARYLPPIAAALLIAVFVPRTVLRNRDWADEVTFFGKMVQQSPDLAAGHLCLGRALIERGRVGEGMAELRAAQNLGLRLRWQ